MSDRQRKIFSGLIKTNLLVAGLSFAVLAAATPAAAAIVPPECLGAADVSACGLNSLVNVFVRIANYIFGISGSLAFIFFIYGGFRWLTSAGKQEGINQGKTIVTNAAIGLIIIFTAKLFVDFLTQAITKGGNVAIEGGSCKPLGGVAAKEIRARYMNFGDKLECIASCDQLAELSKQKYSCDDPGKPNQGCVTGLCQGNKSNVCCIFGKNANGSGGPIPGATTCTCTFAGQPMQLPAPQGAECSTLKCSFDGAGKTCNCGARTLYYSDVESMIDITEFQSNCETIKDCH